MENTPLVYLSPPTVDISAINLSGQNKRMVDISGMPAPPHSVPDPRSCKDFADWVRSLVKDKRFGVTQRRLAEVTLSTPQAVTKWLNGGVIEVERLARIAAWTGLSFQELQRLLNQSQLKTMSAAVPDLETAGTSFAAPELMRLYQHLSPINRKQLIEMAKFLHSKQKRITKK
jgi:transcriptional regulator with XRE-family HTH domain